MSPYCPKPYNSSLFPTERSQILPLAPKAHQDLLTFPAPTALSCQPTFPHPPLCSTTHTLLLCLASATMSLPLGHSSPDIHSSNSLACPKSVLRCPWLNKGSPALPWPTLLISPNLLYPLSQHAPLLQPLYIVSVSP